MQLKSNLKNAMQLKAGMNNIKMSPAIVAGLLSANQGIKT